VYRLLSTEVQGWPPKNIENLARRVRGGHGQSTQRKCCRLPGGRRGLFKLGIRIERVMTDNGSCYRSKSFRAACKRLGLRQIFTKPYTPKTNGKAERFIQTALREWAYARAVLAFKLPCGRYQL
jgi:transposase InsO family protein